MTTQLPNSLCYMMLIVRKFFYIGCFTVKYLFKKIAALFRAIFSLDFTREFPLGRKQSNRQTAGISLALEPCGLVEWKEYGFQGHASSMSKSHFVYLLGSWSWASYITSLNLRFLIGRVRREIPTS